jgi:hypothetical protein
MTKIANTPNPDIVFAVVEESVKSGTVGTPNAVRVLRYGMGNNVNDMAFCERLLGNATESHEKKSGGISVMKISKHKNGGISHIAVIDTGEATLRLEVAGDVGLIDYDSDKAIPVLIKKNKGGCC